MIEVADVVADFDFEAPSPFTVKRSSGMWVVGGFQSVTVSIELIGPVQRASDKEVQMLPEADRVGGVMAFWSLQPIYTTRGALPVPSVLDIVPAGAIPGTVYTLAPAPADGVVGTLSKNGLLLIPNIDYTLAGATLTLVAATQPGDALLYQLPQSDPDGTAASDILVYPAISGEQYRILSVRHYPGSGYWKALGTRMSPI